MTAKLKMRFEQMPVRLEALCRRWLPRPLHDKHDYDAAWEAIEPLIGLEARLTQDQADYLELVTNLLEKYDGEHSALSKKPSGIAMLKYLMAEHEMSATDLSRLLGSDRTLGAKILRGERNLTVPHLRILAHRFKVSPSLFI